jgi:hypothetical protein
MFISELESTLWGLLFSSVFACVVSLYAHLRLTYLCKKSLPRTREIYSEVLDIEKYYFKHGFTYRDVDVAGKLLYWTNKCLILPTTTKTQKELHYFKQNLESYQTTKEDVSKLNPNKARESQAIKARLLSDFIGVAAYMKLLSFFLPSGKDFIRSWAEDSPNDLQVFVDKCAFSGVNIKKKISKDNNPKDPKNGHN